MYKARPKSKITSVEAGSKGIYGTVDVEDNEDDDVVVGILFGTVVDDVAIAVAELMAGVIAVADVLGVAATVAVEPISKPEAATSSSLKSDNLQEERTVSKN